MHENTRLYYNSAKELMMPIYEIPDIEGFKLEFGNYHYYFRGYEVPFNNCSSSLISDNKYATNRVLALHDIPVPTAYTIHKSDDENASLDFILYNLQFPLVVKPLYGSFGQGVCCNITNREDLQKEVKKILEIDDYVVIEKFYKNLQSYRVLLFNNKIIALAKRYPARIIGDGEKTVKELVAIENIKRKQNRSYMKPILFDSETRERFKEFDITQDTIIEKHKTISLNYTSNANRGGTIENIPIKMCKENILLMRKIARVLNLNILGIDIECEDITKPIIGTGGVIIEVNSNPSMRLHEDIDEANKIVVTKKIMRSLIKKHPISYMKHIYRTKKAYALCVEIGFFSFILYFVINNIF